MGISVVGDISCVVKWPDIQKYAVIYLLLVSINSLGSGVLDFFMVLPSVSGLANVTPAFTWQIS